MGYKGLFLIIALLGFEWGCHHKPFPQTGKHPLRTCLYIDPATLDPRKNGDVYSSTVNFLLYEGLTSICSNGDIELALAESVEISDDGKTYTFYLKDACWNDGHPISADDFEYSWKRVLDPRFASPCSYLFSPIKNAELISSGDLDSSELAVKALDARTLQVELEHPTPYFLSLISFCNFYPIPKHVEQENPFWTNIHHMHLVSSGPFELVDWIHNRELRVKKSQTYWDKNNVHLEEISLAIIHDQKTALHLFENGELDLVSTLTMPVNTEDLAYWGKKGCLLDAPMAGTTFCTFNLERFPFHNIYIRKALSFAIDREAIVRHISPFANQAATRCIPPPLMQHEKGDLFPVFAPDLARTCLQRGLRELAMDLATLENACVLSFDSSEDRRKIAQAIQQQWKEVLGIHASLQALDTKSHHQRILSRNYSIAMAHYIAQYNDANNILERFKYKHTQKNLPGFESLEYAALLDEAASICDVRKRDLLLKRAEEILASQIPFAPLYHFNQHALMNTEYTQIEFSPLGTLIYKNVRETHP